MIRGEKLIQLRDRWEEQGFVGLPLMRQMTEIANSVLNFSSIVRPPRSVTAPKLIPLDFDTDCVMVNAVDVEDSEGDDTVVSCMTSVLGDAETMVDADTEESNRCDDGDDNQPSRNPAH